MPIDRHQLALIIPAMLLCSLGCPGHANATGARDMGIREACEALVEYGKAGEMTFYQKAGKDIIDPDRIKECADITVPNVMQITKIALPIAGVDFYYYKNESDSPPPDSANDKAKYVDVRLAVLLYRLSKMLNDQYGVTRIGHNGFGTPDFSKLRDYDAHLSGRALDLARLEGRIPNDKPDGSTSYRISLARHWSKADNKEQALVGEKVVEGRRVYRLSDSGSSVIDRIAASIFKDIYILATKECSDSSDQPKQNRIIQAPRLPGDLNERGKGRGYILHPDYGDDDHAKDHWNHFHLQIATLKPEKLPPS